MSTKRKPKLPNVLDAIPADDVAAARAQDVKVDAILRRARAVPKASGLDPESGRQNTEVMRKMRSGSERAFRRRVKAKELISKEELIELLGGKRRWVTEGLRAGRLFSITDASGHEYFPAFFADTAYDRRALGRVTHALEGLPDESKYYFFMRKSARLQATALEALAQGRTMEVVICALGFATV